MVRFIHAADIHLDSPMRQLESYEGAPAEEIRGSTRRALVNLVDLAIKQAVDFVVIAGDLYDGDWPDHNTGLFFAAQAVRLRSAEIPLYFISGNHDAANKMTKALPLPGNRDGTPMMLSSTKVESIELASLGVVLHGRGFKQQAETDNLSQRYPKAHRGMRNVGILHTSLQGAPGHAPYAPCTPQDLADKEYDYWALGHIHIAGDRAIEGSCPIMYSGNTQGRSVRECGPKGCYLVEFDSSGNTTATFHPTDVCRWEVCQIDAQQLQHADDLLASFQQQVRGYIQEHDGMPMILRARVVGQSALHETLLANQEHWQSALRSAALEVDGAPVWLERFKVHTSLPVSRQTIDFSGPLGELSQAIGDTSVDDQTMRAIIESLEPLVKKLPAELTGPQEEGFQWDTADGLCNVIAEARSLLVGRLINSEANA